MEVGTLAKTNSCQPILLCTRQFYQFNTAFFPLNLFTSHVCERARFRSVRQRSMIGQKLFLDSPGTYLAGGKIPRQ